jgi:hypothetical protein
MNNYEKFGIAAMIPGMQHMIDLMQSELDKMRRVISEDTDDVKDSYSAPQKKYWAKMTPEERSAEVIRRQKVAARNKKKLENVA